jgi:hypothetical protein
MSPPIHDRTLDDLFTTSEDLQTSRLRQLVCGETADHNAPHVQVVLFLSQVWRVTYGR